MIRRSLVMLALPLVACAGPQATPSQTPLPSGGSAQVQAPGRIPDRAVRRDIPLTNMIRRAMAAGTRDST